MDAGFVGERAFAHHAFLPGDGPAGGGRHLVRQRRKTGQVEARAHVVELAQAQRHFFQRRIAGALTQAVHRRVDMRGAALQAASVLAVARPRSS